MSVFVQNCQKLEMEISALWVITIEPIRIQTIKHIKMTVWTSVLWKITIQLAKKWPEMVVEKSFTSIIHFYSDYTFTAASTVQFAVVILLEKKLDFKTSKYNFA